MQERVSKKDRMVRKQLFITADQQRQLKALAAREGVAESDLIRAGIDMKLTALTADAQDDWRERLQVLVTSWQGDAGMTDLGDRIAATRNEQSARWTKRLAEQRKALDRQ